MSAPTIDDVCFDVKFEGGYWNAYAYLQNTLVELAQQQGQTPVTAMIACEASARIEVRKLSRPRPRLVP